MAVTKIKCAVTASLVMPLWHFVKVPLFRNIKQKIFENGAAYD
jgi:hypothetical protein